MASTTTTQTKRRRAAEPEGRPPDAERGPGKGPVLNGYDDTSNPKITEHDPRACATCLGHQPWTEERRDVERSRLACAGVHQLEESLC